MAVLTPEEQWLQINYSRGFLIAVLDRVKAVRDALETLEATAEEISTNINDVPLKFSEKGDPGDDNTGTGWMHIEIGTTSMSTPQVVLDIPTRWVTEV